MLGFRGPPIDRAHGRALEIAIHTALDLAEGTVVRVSEVACGAIGCADVVTALLVMGNGRKTAIHRVAKRLSDVGLDDLIDAMSPRALDPRGMTLTAALAGLGTGAAVHRDHR